MALTTYAELQTAIQTELDRSNTEFTAAIPDLINRAEAKINRKVRLREMEQLAYATFSAATNTLENRLLALPSGYVELIHLWAKLATAADDTFEEVRYVDPGLIWKHYTTATDGDLFYTLRDQIEFNRAVSADHEIMMHYLKGWDIASDSSNWLLTNYPDAYLYGALVEAEVFMRNDARMPMWKQMFEQALAELNELSERGRDDAELSLGDYHAAVGQGVFNILTG